MRKKVLYRVLLCTLWLLALTSASFGQTKTLVGVITDQAGLPLEKATVKAKGEKASTVTDLNGRFHLTVPEKVKALVVSYAGATPQEISVEGKTTLAITINLAESKLNEVVVIGYGTAKRSDVSSAVSSVKAKDLKDLPVAGIDQALQGKVAGVTVTSNGGQPGGGVSIKVRGVTTINSNDPLIVIDGVPFVSNTKENAGFSGLGGSNGQTGNSVMATLNPNDIESIDVLKDASAQAIYGSQAANGVILITTKKGKVGEGKISYDFYTGQQQVYRKLDLMNLREFAKYQNEVAPLIGTPPTEEFKDPSLLGSGTDWQDAIFQNGKMTNHQLSFSGGKDKTTYYLSLNYFNNKGILLGSDFTRYTTRFSLDNQLKPWMKVGISANASRSIQNVTLADAAEGTIWWGTIQSPLIPVKNVDGTWGGGQTISGYQYAQDNPVAMTSYRGNKTTTSQLFGNIYAEASFLKNFTFKNELAFSFGINNRNAFQLSGTIGPKTLQAQLYDYKGNNYYYALRNFLTYNKYIDRHSIQLTAGHEAQYSYFEGVSGKKIDLQNNILDLNTGNSDKETWQLGGGKGQWAMESYFVRGTYTYDDRYSLSVSYRMDGSSNFGPNNKWGKFPGASLGWTITNERFAEPIKSVANYLKLRMGYGAVGNQNLPSGAQNPAYTAAVQFWPGPVGFGQVGSASTNFINGISNPNLGWESVVTKNIGLDATLFKGIIELSVDAYKKTTTKMLLFSTGPNLLGVGSNWDDLKAPIGNVGQMTNTGVDISLTSNNIKNKNFTWKTNVVFTQYTNKLDKLINAASSIDGKVYYDRYVITHTTPGYSVGSFFGHVTDGLFRTKEELDASYPQYGLGKAVDQTWIGDVRFKDLNNDSTINEKDITFIGSPLPKFTFGITNSFQYKNFDASIFIQGSYGAKIYNFLRSWLEKMNNPFFNQLRSVEGRYTESNTTGNMPRFASGSNTNNTVVSDRFVDDGSFVRIQNITIGYRLPTHIISKAKITNVRLYGSVQNLHTFTKYKGYDPEIGAFNNQITLMNVDMGHYPNPRTITIGANIEL